MTLKRAIFFVLFISFASSVSLGEAEKTITQINEDLSKIEESIKITRLKMKQIKDVAFLPDLYFVLGELYVEKSRYLFTLERKKNPKVPLNELETGVAKQAKREAIEVYQRIIENFPKKLDVVDRALFYLAHEYRELGNFEEMIKTYSRITRDYPKSQFWEESTLIVGDFMLEDKKDPKTALEFYQKILGRPQNPFMPLARYKSGWCYINLQKFNEALLAFEGVLTIDANTPLDKLPDIYKKNDIRKEALVALVWPYSEQKKLDAFRSNPVTYFENLAPNRYVLEKGYERLVRRLLVKDRNDVAIPVYYRLLELTGDLEKRIEHIEKFHETFIKSTKDWPLDGMPQIIVNTLLRARNSQAISAADKRKIEINFEIYLRDFVTRLQKKAKATNKDEDFQIAALGYEDYLSAYPENKNSNLMRLNLAETYFKSKKYALAGLKYEQLVRRQKSAVKKDVLDSAIQSYAFALKNTEKLSRLELTESRNGFRAMGNQFLRSFPNDPADAMILFNIGRTYYDERSFDKSVSSFLQFINQYPNSKEVTTAGNLILDSYNQREDFEGLIRAGKGLIANPKITNRQFKSDVSEIVKQAELKKIQKSAGDPRSREYAKKLLGFAEKYKGSTLGVQALYEAFLSFKSKKDPQAYEPGEALLQKFGDSKYAKEVVGQMGQMALNTADYRRAAQYFEIFARKYPRDTTSPTLLKNAAQLRELLGDAQEAAEDYRELGMGESVARQYYLAQDWGRLGQVLTARPLGGVKGSYWLGIALYRQGQIQQAKPYFSQSLKSGASSYEEKKMAAHSLYLLSTDALKDYQAIQLGSGGNEGQLVKVKQDKLNMLTNQFNSVIKFGDGRWTIAALYQLGKAHLEFAQFIEGASVPAGLNEAQVAQYRQLISQQSSSFKQKAQAYFKACIDNGEKFEVFSGFMRGCQNPSGAQVDEASEEKLILKANEGSPSDATAIRRQLFDKPRNVKLLISLGESYLRSQDFATARAVFSRALEVEPKNSFIVAYLGTTLLFSNDLESAQQTFKQALKIKGNTANALWGLAAMYKQFNFQSKFKTTLSKARSAGKPTGIIHPWVSAIQ